MGFKKKKKHHIAPLFLRVSCFSFDCLLSVSCTGFANTIPWTHKMLLWGGRWCLWADTMKRGGLGERLMLELFWGRFLSFLGPIKHRSYFNLLCWEIKLNRAVKSIGPSKTYLKPSAALLEHKERQFPKLLFQWKMSSRFYNRISSCGKPIRNAFVSELSHWLHPS